jgi:hypothetical protein
MSVRAATGSNAFTAYLARIMCARKMKAMNRSAYPMTTGKTKINASQLSTAESVWKLGCTLDGRGLSTARELTWRQGGDLTPSESSECALPRVGRGADDRAQRSLQREGRETKAARGNKRTGFTIRQQPEGFRKSS